ncbi:MAG: hypothetical protein GQ470_06640, partial [Gammaproteobacteria bacterium]|nr:hypothetical protein [Gammaproteobacteria bacterium]
MSCSVKLCHQIKLNHLSELLGKFGISIKLVAASDPIPGSWFGEPEAGIISTTLYIRGDTPVHSALHESCHLICMDSKRRSSLHTNAGGDYDEENGVNYLEITLANYIPEYDSEQLMNDMDCWGYTFRLGSAKAWFEQDA